MEGKYRPPSLPFITGTSILTQDGSPTIHISNREKFTAGAPAGSRSTTPTVMDHAMLQSPGAGQSLLAYQKQDTINSVIAKIVPTLPSAMELTEK